MASLGTAELIGRLGSGDDRAAWEALVERHQRLVLACCWRLLRDDAAAADAAQDALLAIRAYAAGFRPRGRDREAEARGWIARVACSCATHLARSETRRHLRERKADPPRPPEPADIELIAVVRDELAAMAPADRAAIELHYLAGLDHRAVAATLGTSEGAARVRTHRALATLRARLARAGIATASGALAAALTAEVPVLATIAVAGLPALAATPLVAAPATLAMPFSAAAAALTAIAGAAAVTLLAVAIRAGHGGAPGFAPPIDPRAETQPKPPPRPFSGLNPVTLGVKDAPAATAFAMLADLTGLRIAVQAKATLPAVTISLDKVAVADALDALCRQTGTTWRQENGGVAIVDAPPIAPAAQPAAAPAKDPFPGLGAVTLKMEKCDLPVALDWISKLVDVPIRCEAAAKPPISFEFADTPLAKTLDEICRLSGTRWRKQGSAVVVSDAAH